MSKEGGRYMGREKLFLLFYRLLRILLYHVSLTLRQLPGTQKRNRYYHSRSSALERER